MDALPRVVMRFYKNEHSSNDIQTNFRKQTFRHSLKKKFILTGKERKFPMKPSGINAGKKLTSKISPGLINIQIYR